MITGTGPGQRRPDRHPDDRGRPAAEFGGGGEPRPGQRAGRCPPAGCVAAADPARETEVSVLVARGLTNRDIAAQLFLSVRTVEVDVDHILTKLGFRTRTELAAWAYEEGLWPEDM
jgi:DNA-binding CsgD family transcriptional regulator